MFPEINIDDFAEVINLFKEDSGADVRAYISMGRLFIDGDENELMLRFFPHSKDKRLVIARIQFKRQRQGNGTALLKLLKEYAARYNYKSILIENAISSEMHQFAKKNGFTKVLTGDETMDKMEMGDYIIHLDSSDTSLSRLA